MKRSLFNTLEQSRIVRNFEEAFPAATGFSVKLQPVVASEALTPAVANANPFCCLMSCTPEAKAICLKTFASIRDKAAAKCRPGQACCFAGLTHVAIPIISAGEHIATIYGGQLLQKEPTKGGFDEISRLLGKIGLKRKLESLEDAWFRSPVVSEEQMQAIMVLLEVFAGRVASVAAAQVLIPLEGEPTEVSGAREFIHERFTMPITMPETASHVHMSTSNFGKLFKRVVGVTFTQYLAHLRIEKAKSLLIHPTWDVGQIAYESGFNSISQFNRSFRQYADMSPSEYRLALKGEVPRKVPQ